MVFVDASALVAMMTDEEDAIVLAARLDTAVERLTSPIAIFEATAALARLRGLNVEDAARAVVEFLERQSITAVPISEEVGEMAIAAFAQFGKGQGHPAQLNMGDCFAYGCARYYQQPLLFKGADFARTDIEPA